MNACITRETFVFTVFRECFIRLWNSNYVDMHVDVEIQLFRHVDMEKTCRPQHYYLLGIHTLPVEDASQMFHRGCMEIKWSCPISFGMSNICNKSTDLNNLTIVLHQKLYILEKEVSSVPPAMIVFMLNYLCFLHHR